MRKNPHTPYKLDQAFGLPTSYGPHEGWDTNVKGTSGNQDFGTFLYALPEKTPCKIVHTSFSNNGYGRLLVYEVNTPRGIRWIRYCHLSAVLQEGQIDLAKPVARMGSTGFSTASHLHWDVLKKLPKNWYGVTNWRFYAKNSKELAEYFIDPAEFISVWSKL